METDEDEKQDDIIEDENPDYGTQDSADDVIEEEAEKAESEEESEEKPEEESKTEDEGVEAFPEKIQAKFAEMNERHLRLMAEFENFRKRSEKEKDMMFETGAKSVIEKILPTLDNFERALDMAKNGDAKPDPFMEGMEKVYKQFTDALTEMGVKPIEAVGKPFDPNFHNAVMQEESEEYESGTVLKELQKGYLYRDSIVRHSMVSVVQ
ncbi:MAG: nucleotide exchange factor GrpE [Lachnospiraceae bacterium]|nr:nucleotide exchange factor GrpE [Lachnospiraceae bacterium]